MKCPTIHLILTTGNAACGKKKGFGITEADGYGKEIKKQLQPCLKCLQLWENRKIKTN